MEKIHKIVLGLAIIGIVLSVIFSPVFAMLIGFSIWILLWLAQGGLAEGNPYKRMGYSNVPNFIEVKDYKNKEEIEIKDRGSFHTAIFMFGSGGILILVGILWIMIWGF